MVAGNPAAWTARFRTLDERFLERVVAVWPNCLLVLQRCPVPVEDDITRNLVAILSRDSGARRLFHYLEYQYEPFGKTPEGFEYSKGKIDMAVLVDRNRDRYLAYECKRLNVPTDLGLRSLAMEYVNEGVQRFVAEKYAADLPVGCMLGYVLDGNGASARSKVRKAMAKRREEVGLIGKPDDEVPIGSALRFSSRHERPSSTEIELRHALLPFHRTERNS